MAICFVQIDVEIIEFGNNVQSVKLNLESNVGLLVEPETTDVDFRKQQIRKEYHQKNEGALEHGELNSISNDVERLKLKLEPNAGKSTIMSKTISYGNLSRVVWS